MATISDFAAHFRGGVRPNLFRVDIEGPEFFNNFHFFCKGAAIPASTVGVIAVPFRGRQLQVPGDRTFEPWTVTVLNDVDWQHRTAFENWTHRITAYSANVSNFDSGDLGYYGRATVIHLDRSGNVVRRYVLEDIFPRAPHSHFTGLPLRSGKVFSMPELDIRYLDDRIAGYWNILQSE